jgi:hypothetical protein
MATTNFFQKFNKIPYRFGDGELPVNFQDISAYVDVFDQVVEFSAYYQNYQIRDHQRPDQLSDMLYGTPDYYWTFYLMNEKLRISGWPIDNSQVYTKAKEYYPNVVVTTLGTSNNYAGIGIRSIVTVSAFSVGNWVYFPLAKKVAKILRVDNNLSAYYLNLTEIPADNKFYSISASDAALVIADPNYVPPDIQSIISNPAQAFVDVDVVELSKKYNQWDAIHHYEDVNGNWKHPTRTQPPSGISSLSWSYPIDWSSVNTFQSVSYFQRMREYNEELRSIRVLKTDIIAKVVTEFSQLMKLRTA